MIKIKVNEENEYELDLKKEEVIVNQKHISFLNFFETARVFTITTLQGTFQIEVIRKLNGPKNLLLKVNGDYFKCEIKDLFDQLASKLKINDKNQATLPDIISPMPGKVLEVTVSEGQTVNKGDTLAILEAMKMENIIQSEGVAIVKKVHIQEGQRVDKGQVLIEFQSKEKNQKKED